MTKATSLLVLGAGAAFLAVAAGAFGSHALGNRLPADRLAVFETAVRYQMYHALGLLALAGLARHRRHAPLAAVGNLFTAGIVVFSGSLYVLALTGARWWGAVTPIGGLCFLAGWAVLFWSGLRPDPASDS